MGVMPKLEGSAELNKVAVDVQEFVRKQRSAEDDLDVTDLSSFVNGVAGRSLNEIDNLITQLQFIREELKEEAARVQRTLTEYAALAQSALQSTKVIKDSLRSRFPK